MMFLPRWLRKALFSFEPVSLKEDREVLRPYLIFVGVLMMAMGDLVLYAFEVLDIAPSREWQDKLSMASFALAASGGMLAMSTMLDQAALHWSFLGAYRVVFGTLMLCLAALFSLLAVGFVLIG